MRRQRPALLSLLALAACGAPPRESPAPAAPAAVRGPPEGSSEGTPGSWSWPGETASPRPVPPARQDPLLRRCGKGDDGLVTAAQHLVERRMRGHGPVEDGDLANIVRASGTPHVWPRAWLIWGREPSEVSLGDKLAQWVAETPLQGERRCGVARGTRDGLTVVAAVMVDAAGDLSPLPLRGRTGAWLTVEAHLAVAAQGATLVVLPPSGAPQNVPTSLNGRGHVVARFPLREPGAFLVQVVAETTQGPRPVLEALTFADVAPPPSPRGGPAPGEAGAAAERDPERALLTMINGARAGQGIEALARDPRLDALARGHSRAMKAARTVAHHLGDGGPEDRLTMAGLSARTLGENVAHAETVALAHRALYGSPSHRANLLRGGFDRVGLGATTDEDGSVWVTEVFAADLR